MKLLFNLLLFFFLINNLFANKTELEHIKLQLQWKHQFEFAGFYAAKERGFYKDIGLDVEFLELNSGNISELVLDGVAEYGLGYSSIVADYYNGSDIIMIANFFKQSPLVVVTQKDIKTPADLVGKKIMGISDTIHNLTLLEMLSKFNITKDDFINVKTNYKLDSFINKEVDAMSVFVTNEIYYLNKAGISYNILDPIVYGTKYYDQNLFTSRNELLNHPKRVLDFKKASIKGWKYALSHKEELITLIQKKYNPQHKSREALMFEAKQVESIMLPKVYDIGSIDKHRVRLIADTFKQAGYIFNDVNININKFIFNENGKNLYLTDEEKIFLQKKKKLNICIDPDWMPFGAIIDGKYVGIDSDFLKIAEEKIGLQMQIYKTNSWAESLAAIKAKKCDILNLVASTKERREFLYTTTPYLDYSLVIVTKTDKKNVPDVSFLKNKKIAVVKDYAEVELLKKEYPNINVVEVQSIQDGLSKVQNGEVYGFADNAFGIDYYFRDSEFTYKDFKISAHFDDKLTLSYGVRDDEFILYKIMQKVVDSISTEQKSFILNKWFSLNYKESFDYSLFYKALLLVIVVLLFLVYRHFQVQKLNKALKFKVEEELKKSSDKDKMIFHQSKLISMGEMIENIAHQWRQPLSQINSAVLILDEILTENSIEDERIESKLSEIESLTIYMSKTITDFRNFYDNDKEKQKFTLNSITEDAVNIVKGTLDYHSIHLKLEYMNELHCFGYPNELQQVLVIILNNAKDALVSSSVEELQITIRLLKEDGFNIIKVYDNAGGIDDEIAEKIFEPYFTTKHKSQGTGLGLYIAKIIIEESLGGELSMQTTKDETYFQIKLLESYESSNK